jgi:hypothetical protein
MTDLKLTGTMGTNLHKKLRSLLEETRMGFQPVFLDFK